MPTNIFFQELFELPNQLSWINDVRFEFQKEILNAINKSPSKHKLYTSSTNAEIINSVVYPNVYIGHYTLIRNSIILSGSKIGSHVEIANSIILNNVVIPHHNYIGRSIIGNNVKMGGLTRTAVRRLDDEFPTLNYGIDKVFISSTKKLGSFIGDNSIIGSMVLFNPFSIVPKESIIYPGSQISGFYT